MSTRWSSRPSASSSGPSWYAYLLDQLLFYTTAFFVLLAVASIFALIFLVPFFIDPAIATLRADFDTHGTLCRTINGVYRQGKSVCSWSSCEEGCTKTVYTCWQVEVEYLLPGVTVPRNVDKPTNVGRLFPNVKGCGYPPKTNCSAFVERYAQNDSHFTCFVSREHPELVVAELDLDDVRAQLFYSLAIPIPCLLIALAYLTFACLFIYADAPANSYRPVCTLSTTSAMVTLMDVRGATSEEEKKKKLAMLQAQKARLMATQSKSSVASMMVRSGIAAASTLPVPGLVASDNASHAASTHSLSHAGMESRSSSVSEEPRDYKAEHFAKVQEDRKEYGQEKYAVMQYYHYYGML